MTLYISDLDGTLLDDRARLTSFARDAIMRLVDAGVPFTVASARSLTSVAAILGELPLRLPVICGNGGYISDLASQVHQHVHAIESTLARMVYEQLHTTGCLPTVTTSTPVGDRLYVGPPANAGQEVFVSDRRHHADPRLREVEDPAFGLDEAVCCLTVITRRERLAPVADWLAREHAADVEAHLFDDLYTPGWSWLTVHAGRARKDHAIATLVEDHGLADHRLVVFGDEANDLPMFAAADHAVAVANAVPALREVAHEVIGPNTADSVARYLSDRELSSPDSSA